VSSRSPPSRPPGNRHGRTTKLEALTPWCRAKSLRVQTRATVSFLTPASLAARHGRTAQLKALTPWCRARSLRVQTEAKVLLLSPASLAVLRRDGGHHGQIRFRTYFVLDPRKETTHLTTAPSSVEYGA
jgi:hypothetical protein